MTARDEHTRRQRAPIRAPKPATVRYLVAVAASAAGDAIAAADIPVGGGKVFDKLKVVITQPTAGDFKAFSAICTHQGCLVSTVGNGRINCPCHGSSFDMTTAPDALGYFVGDYAGLDFAGSGSRPGFKPFHVRANSGTLANRTDVYATTASTSGP